jgi:hypothetical protein
MGDGNGNGNGSGGGREKGDERMVYEALRVKTKREKKRVDADLLVEKLKDTGRVVKGDGNTKAVVMGKTAAQIQMEKRRAEKRRKMMDKDGGKKSHKKRVSELNEKLASMPDHFDLFRVSGGG